MFAMIDCPACVQIEGDVVATVVSVGIDPNGGYLYLKAGSKRDLFVDPFTTKMITKWDSAQMKDGVDYQLSGSRVGFWSWGPLGHPGDGEFENRSLKAIDIHISYSPTTVVVILQGRTEPGSELFKGQPIPGSASHRPPWAFNVEFSLPRAELKRFLAIPDARYSYFEECLEKSV